MEEKTEFERLDRKLIHRGAIIDLYQDSVRTPSGHVAKWDFIGHKGAAAVVPVTERGTILMVRQYRNAIDRYTLESPAGGRDSLEEKTYDCAARELEEETGFRSDHLELLIQLKTAVAYCNEFIDVYVAKDLVPSHQHLDEDEFINVCEYTVDALCEKIFSGEIQDAKTIAAIMAYKVKYQA